MCKCIGVWLCVSRGYVLVERVCICRGYVVMGLGIILMVSVCV